MINNLDEAIKHCEEKANENKAEATKIAREKRPFLEYARCKQCAKEHEQLAEWLKQLKYLQSSSSYAELTALRKFKAENEKQQGEWIPVSEKLPIRNGCYNVTRIIEGTAISDVCYFDGQNTWHRDVGVNHGRPYLNDIIAWQPLPEPYQKGGAE